MKLPGFSTELVAERSVGAFLGLALGDAYGRPLEFKRGCEVEAAQVLVESGRFRWTDDTHMALYLGRAILDSGPGPLDVDALGAAIGKRFVEWSADPLTPSTAPGNTCLQGAANFARGGDWRRSGVPGSDGCGAVMRIAPLAMAFRGEALTHAARVSALVTHAHPNAVASAVAACQILRFVLERGLGLFDAIRAAIADVQQLPERAPDVVAALNAALSEGEKTGTRLDLAAVPAGDGGWRSPSALGLALAAALRFPNNFRAAVDCAARHDGDSDSVAALAGMFIGASVELPAGWLAALPERDAIAKLAAALTARPVIEECAPHGCGPSQSVAPEKIAASASAHPPGQGKHQQWACRTSASDPIRVDWLKKIEELAGPGRGRIGITFAPGKKGPAVFGRPWDRDLDADMTRLRQEYGADVLICLLDDSEMRKWKIEGLIECAQRHGIIAVRVPVPDLHAPTVEQARYATELAVSAARAGRRVIVHCRGGRGRAGTLGACCYVQLGHEAAAALRDVRQSRDGAVETAVQEAFISTFASAVVS